MKIYRVIIFVFFCLISVSSKANDGYNLWLDYKKVEDTRLLTEYQKNIKGFYVDTDTDTGKAINAELKEALSKLLGKNIKQVKDITAGTLVVSSGKSFTNLTGGLKALGSEGFTIRTVSIHNKRCILINANTDIGALYGVFHFLKLIQTGKNINELSIESSPKLDVRALNHWDNLDGSIERGYAGKSLWKWDELPGVVDPRYKDYARANASIGINASVINNVNANPLIMTEEYLPKVKALADVFRPYGVKVYLSISFSAPMRLGGLKTADPLNPEVIKWWEDKANEIYRYIPDFGGFLVKANSEGQPGPQDYGRNHADGANMLAKVLKPHAGIVMWRAFVYNSSPTEDRVLQAYNSFKPLDGDFDDNVLIQIKNGPIDFQPREPFSPLFGAMPNTSLMMEFQVTQEYLGFSKHLVFLAPLYEEVLESDTYSQGKGSTVAKVIEGELNTKKLTGMAGVSNIGNDTNWCGHPFGQANWYALGRLAWNPQETSAAIAEDWIRMTFTNAPEFVEPVEKMMLESRETTVNYMTPLGLHHIMGYDQHWGPGPWVDKAAQPNWKSTYYHRADTEGIGFDRSSTGSDAVAQYFPPVRDKFNSLQTCPENLLLWFHHVPWTYKMKSGNTLWDELCYHYYDGVKGVRNMESSWASMKPYIDAERYEKVKFLLGEQETEALIWRNSCVLYFQTFSGMPIPQGLEIPDKSLDYYKALRYHR